MTHRRAVLHDTHDAPTGTVIIICRQCGRPFNGYPARHTCADDAQPATFEAELLATRTAAQTLARWLDEMMTCPARLITAAELDEINKVRKVVGLEEVWR
jgi:hypothetical protein